MALLAPARGHAEKKTGHAVEQDRPDVPKRRLDWFDGQLDLAPERLVFIDENEPFHAMGLSDNGE